jgi:hypothetical protein
MSLTIRNRHSFSTYIGPGRTSQAGQGQIPQYVIFGRLTYRELTGKIHHTGFAWEVAPFMPAAVAYANDAYHYYD